MLKPVLSVARLIAVGVALISDLQPASAQCAGRRCRTQQDPGTLFDWKCQSLDAGVAGLDEGLVTDRPDFTEASSVVGLGVVQMEIGYTYTEDGDARGHSYPEPLLRYGILRDWLELRIGWNYADEETPSAQISGSEDLYLGFKIGLTAQDGIRPEMAIIPQMTVPTGDDVFTSNEVLAGVNWLYGWDVTENVSTAGSTQFNRSLDDATDQAYTEWAQSWTVGFTLTEKVGAYTEWYAFFPSGADTNRVEHYFNGGFAIGLSDDVQWDIRAGLGLNDAADDFLVGTGLSVRFR